MVKSGRLRRFQDRVVAGYADELSQRVQGGRPVPLAPAVDLPSGTYSQQRRAIAVICHAYYTDLLAEVREVVERIPRRVDLFFSVVDSDAQGLVESFFRDWEGGDVVVRVVENRGRDIAPKYVTFAEVYDSDYELMLFLHTKKSSDREMGARWRHHLFDSLGGSPERVAGVLALFDADAALGVLAPEHFGPVMPWIGWDGNYPQFVRLARRIGLVTQSWSPPDFPSGSMFWARPEALVPITRLALRRSDFPDEAAQIQSTIMHALERLVYVGAASVGFRSAVLRTEGPADVVAQAGEGVSAARPDLGVRLGAWWVGFRRAVPDRAHAISALGIDPRQSRAH